MPSGLKCYYGDGHLHFVIFSCFRRRPFLDTARRKDLVLRMLEQTRVSYGFVIVGYVVMPEHVHLLVSEPIRKDLSTAIKAFKQSVSRRLLRTSRKRNTSQMALFADSPAQRFWQTRFYDFNVFTEKKRVEKLRYMHRNPVKRGLVDRPEDWRWSSYRSYAYAEAALVQLNVAPATKIRTRAASA